MRRTTLLVICSVFAADRRCYIPTVALLLPTRPLISTARLRNPFAPSLGEGPHRSLSFAVQRACFQTKRSFPATNRAAEFALNNLDTPLKERECVGSPRVAQRQQCGDWGKPAHAGAATQAPGHSLRRLH